MTSQIRNWRTYIAIHKLCFAESRVGSVIEEQEDTYK